MSVRFVIRKNSGDPAFPWTFRDAACPDSEHHDFSEHAPLDDPCNGNCDAFGSFAAAIGSIWMVRS